MNFGKYQNLVFECNSYHLAFDFICFDTDEVLPSRKQTQNDDINQEIKEKISPYLGEKEIEKMSQLSIKKNKVQKLVDLFEVKNSQQSKQSYQPIKSNIFGFSNVKKLFEETFRLKNSSNRSDSNRLSNNSFGDDSNAKRETNYTDKIDEKDFSQYEVKMKALNSRITPFNNIVNEVSFCEYFFGVSLPDEKIQKIQFSEGKYPECGHAECQMFPSYKPEIKFRFPTFDKKNFELNSLIASLCFPNGIKMCYSYAENIKNPNNFMVVITNGLGERFYIQIFNYYEKFKMSEFFQKHEINLFKDFLNVDSELAQIDKFNDKPKLKKEVEAKIFKKVEEIKKLLERETVYLPACICLMSRFPFYRQMERCLKSIFKIYREPKYEIGLIYKLAIHFTQEIPIPPNNELLRFRIPFYDNPIEIPGSLMDDLNPMSFSFKSVFEKFTVEIGMKVYHLIINESKILFICDNYNSLTEVVECFLNLIYPLQWTYPYIPILSVELIKYIQTPLPFIMGIHKNMFDSVLEYLSEEDEVYFVFINENKSSFIEKFDRKKIEKKFKILPKFPKEVKSELLKSLRKIRKKYESNNNTVDNKIFDREVRTIFAESMTTHFGDFTKYVSFIDFTPLFNKESFLTHKSIVNHDFYEKLIDSQNFSFFLQTDLKKDLPFFYNLIKDELELSIKDNELQQKRSCSSSKNITLLSGKKPFRNSTDFTSKNMKLVRLCSLKNTPQLPILIVNIVPFQDKILEREITNEDYKRYFIIQGKKRDLNFSNLEVESVERYIVTNPVIEIKPNGKRNSSSYDKSIRSFDFRQEIVEKANKKNKKVVNVIKKKSNQKLFLQELESILSDNLKKIFTSYQLTEQELKQILLTFNYKHARNFLGILVYQDKFKEKISHCLSLVSFHDLSQIFFNSLLVFNDYQDFDSCVMITKSSFLYYKEDNDEEKYFIYQELVKKNGVFFCWNSQNFWLKWHEFEIKELGYIYGTMELNLNIIKKLRKYMHFLKINNEFIHDCLIQFIAPQLFDSNEIIIKLSKEIKDPFDLN